VTVKAALVKVEVLAVERQNDLAGGALLEALRTESSSLGFLLAVTLRSQRRSVVVDRLSFVRAGTALERDTEMTPRPF
jgi:hypothetical protein